jgi:hypothetical protein
MTAIGSVGISQFTSPLDLLQNALNAQVSAGTINSSDKSALSSALDDIDNALKNDQSSSGGSGASTSRTDIKTKIDNLIASEVSNGKLTSSQADELKTVFAKAFAGGPPGDAGPGGTGSPGGTSSTASQDGSGTSQNSSSGSDISKLLQDFQALLQKSQGSSGYDATGDTQSSQSSLLFSYQS